MALRNHVTFRTSQFNQTEVLPHFINPCCFGEDCAAWLADALRGRGIAEVSAPWQEDWGWQFSCQVGDQAVLVSVSLTEETPSSWLVFANAQRPLLKRLFGGAAREDALQPFLETLHKAIEALPDVRDIGWHVEEGFEPGREGGSPTP